MVSRNEGILWELCLTLTKALGWHVIPAQGQERGGAVPVLLDHARELARQVHRVKEPAAELSEIENAPGAHTLQALIAPAIETIIAPAMHELGEFGGRPGLAPQPKGDFIAAINPTATLVELSLQSQRFMDA
jgi:hypothetical protein